MPCSALISWFPYDSTQLTENISRYVDLLQKAAAQRKVLEVAMVSLVRRMSVISRFHLSSSCDHRGFRRRNHWQRDGKNILKKQLIL